jgi:AcrR family transcriptional regulator
MSSGVPTEARPPSPRLRADAKRNRARILETAASVFAEHGLQVGVELVAVRAGVGIGTLYRHFATKAELIDAVFEERLEEFARIAADLLRGEDPWDAFCRFLERVLELQARNRGFNDLLRARLRENPQLTQTWSRGVACAESLIVRAQAAGALRADITFGDVRALFWATGHVMETTAAAAPEYWRRYLALTLDALRAENATPLLGAPLAIDPGRHAPSPDGDR